MISLSVSGFSGGYNHLNGMTSQNIKRLDLTRALVTVGRDSWGDVFEQGVFRIGELICKGFAFSDYQESNLVLNNRFHRLNQSEKVTVSYYFGQALTKLFAEEFLDVKWLFHLDEYQANVKTLPNGTATPKLIVGNSDKDASRPDLIGIKSKNVSHILEAKGSSTGYSSGVMQHAINQVSQVVSYNNVFPETKTACYFDLSASPINGIIIDPENDGKGIELKFDEELFISRFYSFFFKNENYFTNIIKVRNFEFLTVPVGVPNLFFGFDKRILELSSEEISEKGLYEKGEISTIVKDKNFNGISLGNDGLILINRN